MISYSVYNYLHVFGLVLVTAALGVSWLTVHGIIRPKWVMALHGVGLVLILLGGFGMAARLGFTSNFPVWVQWKIAFWVLVGFLPLILKFIKAKPAYVIAAQILFLLLAAAFGIFKPFTYSI